MKPKPKSTQSNPAVSNPVAESGSTTQVDQQQTISSLADQKLALEVIKLRFESGWGRWLEGGKAIVPLLGSVALLGTLWLGIRQLSLAQRARDDERFERAVTRLSSLQPSERLTGLAGLQQFLRNKDVERQESTLIFLVNAAVVETDSTLRQAILDTFANDGLKNVSAEALNATLLTTRDRNRTALADLVNDYIARSNAAGKRLPDPRFKDLLVGDPEEHGRIKVETTAKLLASLVLSGAQVSDLSGIYCVHCSFSSREHPANLGSTNFSNALLRRADFTAARLTSVNFNNADLTLAVFMSADLSGAKITADTPLIPPSQSIAESTEDMASAWGTNFACSNLRDADFSGRLLFSLVYNNPVYGGNFHDEFYAADLTNTSFKSSRIAVAVPKSLLPATYTSFLQVPDMYLPLSGATAETASQPVKYFNGSEYVMFYYPLTQGFVFKSLPNPFHRDLALSMSSLLAGKNLAAAQLPDSVETFITHNKTFFDKAVISFDCSNGNKKFDASSFLNDPGPKSTRF